VDWSVHAQHPEDVELDGGEVVEQPVKLVVLFGLLDAFVNGDNQLVGLIDGQLPLGIHDRVQPRLNELLLQQVEVLVHALLVGQVVLQRGDRPFHVESASLLAAQPACDDSHKVSHNCLGCDYPQLLILFLFIL